jgi:hypothetical protein
VELLIVPVYRIARWASFIRKGAWWTRGERGGVIGPGRSTSRGARGVPMSIQLNRGLLVLAMAAVLTACSTPGPPPSTGTRMMQETCLTQAQMDAQEENARNFTQGVQGIALPPPSSPNVR